MNDTQNYEKLIQKKSEGKILFSKILLIILYSLFAIIGVLLIIFLGNANPMLFVLAAIIEWLLAKFSWRLTQVEYEYTIIEDMFLLSKILGKSTRSEIFESKISDATLVAPYTEQYIHSCQEKNITRTISAISSQTAEDIWFILFEKESGEKIFILFEADTKSLKLLRRYCPRAVARDKLKKEVVESKSYESEN